MDPLYPPALPLELIHEIVLASLDHVPVDRAPGLNNKLPWGLAMSLSLTCKAIRELVLKAWFCRLYTENPEDTTQLTEKITQVKREWVKYLHCVLVNSDSVRCGFAIPWNLEGYCHLESVRIDWMTPFIQFPDVSTDFPFVNTPPTIVTFDFRGQYWPTPGTFTFVPRHLSYIRNLYLYQENVWCSLCFTVNEVEFRDSVSHRIQYGGGFGLPPHYAKILEPLKFLEHVYIYVPVYDSGLVSINQSNNPNMWVGECNSCLSLLLADQSFADDYLSRKQRGIIRLADGTENKWRRPPSLRSVVWIFLPATSDDARNLFHFNAEIPETVQRDSGSDSEREEDEHEDYEGGA